MNTQIASQYHVITEDKNGKHISRAMDRLRIHQHVDRLLENWASFGSVSETVGNVTYVVNNDLSGKTLTVEPCTEQESIIVNFNMSLHAHLRQN